MDEQQLKEKLGLILGVSIRELEKTTFVHLMQQLVRVIEDYEKVIKIQNESIEYNRSMVNNIEDYIKILKHGTLK